MRLTRFLLILSVALCVAFGAEAAKPRAKKKQQPAKPTPEQLIAKAQAEFDAYQFDEALATLTDIDTPEASDLRRRAELGTNMMGRVEQVAIIDSVTLPLSNLMSLLPLSPESGRLFAPTSATLPSTFATESGAFATADGRRFIWSAPGEARTSHLVTGYRLVDGSLEPPADLGSELHIGNRVDFPYLMPDGITLYFAADGDGSLGGLDIFMSRNNGDDFLQPQNLGMPYNSPFNDYMMAIDEYSGYGFWVTDRNQIADSVTLYMFRVNDMRKNYPADAPELADMARITSVAAAAGVADSLFMKAYREPGNAQLPANHTGRTTTYSIEVPGVGIITSSSQITTQMGMDALGRYLGIKQQLDDAQAELATLRVNFANGDTSAAPSILSLESRIPNLEKQLREAANAVIRAESTKLAEP
ncbi:MAG: PD40 domain-containing protein [Muribaculaceae bacterium]|nr:PD40 domain-containing protein [Muribaculaceae bacterium]